ncbi:hypothetical protein SpCBS45565_g00969 [Spizellomyces sp. 'palustris']|nr:hypothetical protein SpCBS45565_g00969 [Spizellomyces sp. 'palustris']
MSYFSTVTFPDLLFVYRMNPHVCWLGPLVTLEPTTTLLETLKNISCAPVVRSDTDFVLTDVVDIVRFWWSFAKTSEADTNGRWARQVTFLSNAYAQLGQSTFEEHLKDIVNVPCEDLADFSSRNPTITLPSTSTVHTVLKALQQHHTTRLILLTNQTLHHIVTQTSLVEFALLNLDRLHPSPDASLLELGFVGTTPVFACRENKVVLEVLREMRERGVTAVPVVNSGMVMSGMMTVRHVKTSSHEAGKDVLPGFAHNCSKAEGVLSGRNWVDSTRSAIAPAGRHTHKHFVSDLKLEQCSRPLSQCARAPQEKLCKFFILTRIFVSPNVLIPYLTGNVYNGNMEHESSRPPPRDGREHIPSFIFCE